VRKCWLSGEETSGREFWRCGHRGQTVLQTIRLFPILPYLIAKQRFISLKLT
jgi:hypothetical protein